MGKTDIPFEEVDRLARIVNAADHKHDDLPAWDELAPQGQQTYRRLARHLLLNGYRKVDNPAQPVWQHLSDFPEVRARIQPLPDRHYPAPWRAAETDASGNVVVVCEDGPFTCTAPTPEAAQIIVLAVNAWASS